MNGTFAHTLLEWYDANRRELPWRGETDPYRIWLSEVMLQQTRTETVERYYRAFLERFPRVQDLAAADEGEVLKLWEGMGYYSRARNLHKAARMVAFDLNGVFPRTAKELRALPGVGPYASGAIASIAYNEPVPALDGNQARVLSRVLACEKVLKTPADLWDEAVTLLSAERPGDYNQALMDLGASVCIPKNPRCEICPVQALCRAYQEGAPEEFPVLPPPVMKREEERTVALVLVGDRLLMRQRPAKGLLARMWEFPNFEGALTSEETAALLREEGAGEIAPVKPLPPAKHVFTHLVWRMTGHLLRAESVPADCRAVDLAEMRALAIPSAIRAYREIAEDLLREK